MTVGNNMLAHLSQLLVVEVASNELFKTLLACGVKSNLMIPIAKRKQHLVRDCNSPNRLRDWNVRVRLSFCKVKLGWIKAANDW